MTSRGPILDDFVVQRSYRGENAHGLPLMRRIRVSAPRYPPPTNFNQSLTMEAANSA
jgi:hypothetical protein